VPLSRRYARHFALSNSHAVRVESVEDDGPARRAGLEAGDLIVQFDTKAVNGIDDLHRLLTADRIGATSRVAVLRRAQRIELDLKPRERS